MKRRAVLAAGAAVALAGCSGDGGSDDTDGSADPGNASPADETEAEDSDDVGNASGDDAIENPRVSVDEEGDEEDEPEEYGLVVLVIDDDGEPIEGATVAVAEDGETVEAFDGADRATTDESGSVEATLPEGSYQAGAIADGRQTVRSVEVDADGRILLRIEPTEEERAAEAIDRAQSTLSEAVAELDEQSGDALDADDELSTAPVGDRLVATRLAIEDARAFETTDDQEATLSALDAASAFVRAVLDAQPWLHRVARSIDRLVDALREGEDDRAIYTADDVSRELEDGGERIGELDERAAAVEGSLEGVEAIDWLWVDDRRASLRADYRAAGEIAGTVEELLAAEETLEGGREAFDEGAYVIARSSFGGARRGFEDVRTGFEPPESSAFDDAVEAIDCRAAAMATAADRYYWAADAARSGDDDRGAEYVEEAEAATAEAEDCGLGPIA